MKDTFEVEVGVAVRVAHQSESSLKIAWKGNSVGRINEKILKSTGLLYTNRGEAEHGTMTESGTPSTPDSSIFV